MGKMTRRPLTFLLALANVRLGVWVPNPRWVAVTRDHKSERRELEKQRHKLEERRHGTETDPGDRELKRQLKEDERELKRGRRQLKQDEWRLNRYKKARPSYLLRELIGRNRVDSKYLYVTDGGHYENLGLVELLRRGCTKIYCFDASGTQGCEALGDAVALARNELEVNVDINPTPLFGTSKQAVPENNSIKGTFRYDDPEATEGTLIYSATVLTQDAPWDVQAYHKQDPAFPHNSTIDQLCTDQRFEAYRALGFSAGMHAVARMRTRSGPPSPAPVANGQPEAAAPVS
jgi:hypothetical protein